MMNNYKAICLDLDGTVYRGIEPIPEAVHSSLMRRNQVWILIL